MSLISDIQCSQGLQVTKTFLARDRVTTKTNTLNDEHELMSLTGILSHHISLKTAMWMTLQECKFRI